LLNSKYQILLKEKDSNKLLKESIANVNNQSNNMNDINIKEEVTNLSIVNQERKISEDYLEEHNYSENKINKQVSVNEAENISSFNIKPNLIPDSKNNNLINKSNYASNTVSPLVNLNLYCSNDENSFTKDSSNITNGRTSLKDNSVDTKLSKYDIKSNMKRRTSVHSQQKNKNNSNNNEKQIKNNLVNVNNNLKSNNFNSNYNTDFNSENYTATILGRGENKRFSELQNNFNNRDKNYIRGPIPNVNINLSGGMNNNNRTVINDLGGKNNIINNNENKAGFFNNIIGNIFKKK